MGNNDSSLISREKERKRTVENFSSLVQNEMTIQNVAIIPMKIVHNAEKSVCKIDVLSKGTGTGFFGVIRLGERQRYGLFTNNHVIGQNNLCSGYGITCILGINGEREIELPVESYCFTCKLLDVTFIEVTNQKREEIKSIGYRFMGIGMPEPPAEGEQIFILQHPRGEDLSIAASVVKQLQGFNIHHKVSTDYGSSGSPVMNASGCVIGIHKIRCERLNCNVAVEMASVVKAIHKDIIKRGQHNNAVPSCTPDWSQAQLNQLPLIGLRQLSTNLFVSPAERLLGMVIITPIWFYWTCSFWYWTPTNPEDDAVNWMRISPNDGLKVIGGLWHGETPADKNIRIIHYLKTHPDLL